MDEQKLSTQVYFVYFLLISIKQKTKRMKKLSLKRNLSFRSLALAGIFLIAVFAVSCNKQDDIPEPMYQDVELKKGKPDGVPNGAPAPGDYSIAEIVVAANEAEEPEFTLLFAALEYAGLTEVFTGGDQYTVFAPTDKAFVDLVNTLGVAGAENPFAAIDALIAPATVADVLLYHVTEGRRAANSVVPPMNAPAREVETLLENATFSVESSGKIWAIGSNAMIVTPNISASNGIIHEIDTVLLPIE